MDFERFWFENPKAWKQLVSRCQETSQPVPVLSTFTCDQCDAVCGKLRALRSHQMRAHQRRREARRYLLDSVCSVCKADFRSRPRVIQHLEVGAMPCLLTSWTASTGGCTVPPCAGMLVAWLSDFVSTACSRADFFRRFF